MPASVSEQLIIFGTNNCQSQLDDLIPSQFLIGHAFRVDQFADVLLPAGLERLLRFIQALLQILTSYPVIIVLLESSALPIHLAPEISLYQLQHSINLTRRLLRFFRFLEAFSSAWQIYLSDIHGVEMWLDMLCKSTLGMFGMLESATLLDLLQLDQLEIFGAEQTAFLNYQAQFFWLIALYASMLSCSIRLLHTFAYKGNSKIGRGFSRDNGDVQGAVQDASEGVSTAQSLRELASNEDSAGRITTGSTDTFSKNRSQIKAQMNAESEKAKTLVTKLVADSLDLMLPASAVGWVQADRGLVGIAMLCSTVITTREIWLRCGRDIQS